MHRIVEPADVAAPLSRYAHGIVHPAGASRLVIAGQVGVLADGSFAQGLQAQTVQCFANLLAVARAAGMGADDLVRIVVYCTVPGGAAVYREVRDRVLEGRRVAATYVQVVALASPQFLIEIEGEAVAREG